MTSQHNPASDAASMARTMAEADSWPGAFVWRRAAGTVVKIARLALLFGRIERLTLHEDGQRRETDAEHTVMLGLVAAAFASRHLPWLDRGLIVSYTLVHDLVEAYAGDTNTLRMLSDSEKAAKKIREQKAFHIIEIDMGEDGLWIPDMIDKYEALADDEACYVKAMDKLLPKATHIMNYCATIQQQDMTFEDLARRYEVQYNEIAEYLDPEKFRPVFELRGELIRMVFERYWRNR